MSNAAQAAIAQYDLAFQVSPIFLQGGIASKVPGGLLPIIALYNQLALYTQLTGPSQAQQYDDFGKPIPTQTTLNSSQFFARYVPLPGSTLIENQIGMYPFANQSVAANAIIQQPLKLSMLMHVPVNQPGGYLSRLATMSALVQSLTNHNIAGGTYSVATPVMVYASLVMTGMTDVTHTESNQVQIQYQLEFVAPLLTQAQATAQQNTLLAKITNGGQTSNPPSYSGSQAGLIPATTQGLYGALQQYKSTPNLSSDAASYANIPANAADGLG